MVSRSYLSALIGALLALCLTPAAASAAWTSQTVPAPAGTVTSYLYGTSCISTYCSAVGLSSSGTGALPYEVRGVFTPTTSLGSPVPGATATVLKSVSCGATTCVAVGFSSPNPGTKALIERFANGSWTIESATLPTAPTVLTGVDGDVAVGYYVVNGLHNPFSLRWNGTSWTPLTLPAGIGSWSDLNGVSCGSFCIAVGASSNGALALKLDASTGTWSAMGTPVPSATLTGVDCPGLDGDGTPTCFAVGNNGTQAVALQLRSSWLAQAVPQPGAGATLNGVGCSSAYPRTCVAVGATGGQPFAVSRTTGGWLAETVPNAPGFAGGTLAGAFCTDTNAGGGPCLAVGYGSAAGNTTAFLTKRS
jgi:hypothetical protein